MRATKDSGVDWLGEIPSDWDVVPARALFSNPSEPNKPDDVHLTPSQKYGVLPQEDYMEVSGSRVVLNLSGADNMRHVNAGDYISHLRSFQGGLEFSGFDGKVSAAYTVLRPRCPIDAGYFKHLFKSTMYVQGLQTTTDQLRDGQSIRFGQFSLLALPNPPLEEQRAIADFLDRETAKIDKLIAKQEQLVATLGERLQAEISKRVLQGLGTDADLKDSGVSWMGHIVSGWTVSRIGRHYDLTLGKMLNEQSQTEGVTLPYVRAGSIQEDGIDFENIKTMGFSSSDVKSYQILPGDVLVVEGGSIGRSIYLPGGLPNWGFQNHVIRLRALKNQFPGFVDFYIKHLKAIGHFDRLSAFATIPNLSADKLSKIEMPVPPLSQQVAIFEHLSEETRLVKELQRKAAAAVDLLQERRQALISAAVTGKILVDE
jgi:type I restriction enzyme S subunit